MSGSDKVWVIHDINTAPQQHVTMTVAARVTRFKQPLSLCVTCSDRPSAVRQ